MRRLLFLLLPLAFNFAVADRAVAEQEADLSPVVVFVHGRGQGERTLDDVRSRFFNSFRSSQRTHFGSEILPESAMRFVWYSDVIDPKSSAMPLSDTCRFAGETQVDATFRRDLRRSLISIGQRVGLNDAALNAFAGDTHKYLTNPAVRCEADARVSQAFFAPDVVRRPIIVVAHSMGGIVAFSAIDRLSSTTGVTARPRISRFVTIGTQVGVTEILQGVKGSLVRVPVPVPNIIEEWENFQNESDLLAFPTLDQFQATDLRRVPLDQPIKSPGDSHAVETYLGNEDVIVTITKAWCAGFQKQAPKECSLTERKLKKSSLTPDDVRGTIALLSHFFSVPPPSFSISDTAPTGVQNSIGQNPKLSINTNQLTNYQQRAGALDFESVLLFFLAHELAHIAQARQSTNDRRSEPPVVRECEADLWAGMALLNVRPVMGDLATEFLKVSGAITAAAESGSALHLGGGVTAGRSHPEAIQRAICAVRGLSAGLNMVRFRQLALSARSGGLAPESEIWNTNPEELGPAQDPWQWTLRNARRITIESITGVRGELPFLGDAEMIRLAQGAERGPADLLSAGVLVDASKFAQCHYHQRGSLVVAHCVASNLPSPRLALESFTTTIAMLKPVLLSRGWSSDSVRRSATESVETFKYGNAKSIARVDLTKGSVTIDFQVAQ